ncbi:TPA: ATP-binding protein [Bacillus cereus]
MREGLSLKHQEELDVRNYEELENGFQLASSFVQKNYINELVNYEVVPLEVDLDSAAIRQKIRLFKVGKLVYDKNENIIDKLLSVYNAVFNVKSAIIMLLDSDGERTNLYLGVRTDSDEGNIHIPKETLEKSFSGNFPGSDIKPLRNPQIEELLNKSIDLKYDNSRVISTASGIPSLKDNNKENFVQGMEKLVDAMKGETFTAIFISDPILHKQVAEMQNGYERLYSQLVPFAQCDFNFSINDSQAVTDSLTLGFNETLNESLTQTQSFTNGDSETQGNTKNLSGFAQLLGRREGTLATGPVSGIGGTIKSVVARVLGSTSKSESVTKSRSKTEGTSSTTGKSTSTSTQEGESETLSTGNTKGIQLNFENKAVTNLLEQIDEQLNRLKSSNDFGMWNTACYFVAPSRQVAEVAASTFKAIMRGENSSIEHSAINTWTSEQKDKISEVGRYLKQLKHPVIDMKVENGLDMPYVTPGSLLSGKEVAIMMNLPRKSVSGIPVLETAEFGRNVFSYEDKGNSSEINIGKVFHMGKVEQTNVEIDVQSLAMHTFVTGSTGSGKSNTIYKLLHELNRKRIPFLVIEPAKGEYKQIFGGREDVHVFGTNSKFTPLLKINPFKFPDEIHVLEHIDRLVEIFNACWPMYAAMPAVLKEALERVYEENGWDLELSLHIEDELSFPTMHDLVKVLPEVIHESGYSEELKSNYIGALVTRVKSLTNGLVGRIFTGEEIENRYLFDENCLIDLSRIGSSETKALLMGILFMRLQEHRMVNAQGMNQTLQHVTVLEEAHHLLPKTSNSQSQEGSNLQGKSVEMITNAIAEMRTYGEGFIIADQSPNLLDTSVIRNTNTKIILRLPEGSDRREVGLAASLNEDQINEIPKLKTGVSIVYQNNWLQPVLCAFEKYENKNPYVHKEDVTSLSQNKKNTGDLLKILLSGRMTEKPYFNKSEQEINELQTWLSNTSLPTSLKQNVLMELSSFKNKEEVKYWEQSSFDELSKVVWHLLQGDKLQKYAKHALSFDQYNEKLRLGLKRYIALEENCELGQSIIQCLLYQHSIEKPAFKDFYFNWVEDARQKERYL